PVATSIGSDLQTRSSAPTPRSRGSSGLFGFGLPSSGPFPAPDGVVESGPRLGGGSGVGSGLGAGGGSAFGGAGPLSLGGGVWSDDGVVESFGPFDEPPSPCAEDGVVELPPPPPPPFPPVGGVSTPFGDGGRSACFGLGAAFPGLISRNALAASENSVPARLSSGTSDCRAFTRRLTRSAILLAVFATALTTCGTTQVSPMPRVNTTCSAQLIMWPTSSATMSRTSMRTAPTTSPAVFTPLEAPSQPFCAEVSSVTVPCARWP